MKKCGILLPIFSLPNKYGIGTLGKSAYKFIDFLKLAKQNYWQILPINPTTYGDSPYQSFSCFAFIVPQRSRQHKPHAPAGRVGPVGLSKKADWNLWQAVGGGVLDAP